jgi:hypothetical protein
MNTSTLSESIEVRGGHCATCNVTFDAATATNWRWAAAIHRSGTDHEVTTLEAFVPLWRRNLKAKDMTSYI